MECFSFGFMMRFLLVGLLPGNRANWRSVAALSALDQGYARSLGTTPSATTCCASTRDYLACAARPGNSERRYLGTAPGQAVRQGREDVWIPPLTVPEGGLFVGAEPVGRMKQITIAPGLTHAPTDLSSDSILKPRGILAKREVRLGIPADRPCRANRLSVRMPKHERPLI